MKSRRLNIIGLLLNLSVLACFAVGIYFIKDSVPVDYFKHFAVLTSIVTVFASLLMLIPNIISIAKNRPATPKLFFSLRFFSATMSVITLVAVLILAGSSRSEYITLTNGRLFFYVVIPAISVFMFLFIEIQKKERFGSTFAPLGFTLIYALAILIPMFVIYKKEGATAAAQFSPNSFFCFTKDILDAWKSGSTAGEAHYWIGDGTYPGNMIIGAILFVSVYVAALLLFIFNRITYAIFVGVEYKDKKAIEKEKEERKKLTRGERFKNYLKNEVSFKDVNYAELNHVYHISYQNRKLKTWKVKSASAGRALKIFNTQQEAIDFAKQQVALHGGSIRIHSVTGAMRKQNMWDSINAGKESTPVANKTAHKKPEAKKVATKKAPAKKKKK